MTGVSCIKKLILYMIKVEMGGHAVPEDTIRRRYHAGLKNFFNLYQSITDGWKFYDNSDANQFNLENADGCVARSVNALKISDFLKFFGESSSHYYGEHKSFKKSIRFNAVTDRSSFQLRFLG